MEMNPSSLKTMARRAGLMYFVWILTGLYGLFYIPSQITLQGNAAAIAGSILSNEFLFRTSIINDLLSNTLWVFLVLALYRMFTSVSERQAKLLVALVLVQIPVAFVMGAFNIASLMIVKGEVLNTFELTQRQDVAALFLRIGDYGVLTLELFWGLWLFPLGILVYRSRFLPRFLGVWLIINGVLYVVLSFTSLLLPHYKDMVFKIGFPAMFGEVALMLWLLIRGAKEQAASSAPME